MSEVASRKGSYGKRLSASSGDKFINYIIVIYVEMVDLELQKIDLDVEGHIRLQCGTTQHIQPKFKLLLPSNIDLENDIRRVNEWHINRLEKFKKKHNINAAIPLVQLTRVRIVAYLYATDIEGREIANVQDDALNGALRSVALYDQANPRNPFNLNLD